MVKSVIESLNPIEILLVEDNPGDIRLTQEVLKEGQICNHLNVVDDGEKAIAFLTHTAPYSHAPNPHLVLLDLNLPRRSGLEVLETIKTNETLKHIPVIVFTSSHAEEDIMSAYNLHANCYITKPIDLEHFTRSIKSIEDFWLSMVELPSE
ncbi:response regulator [Nodosilinea sp. LEGE 06152]|uniref:response regulator n=1 Tax=Nodosilinea sp. LEGE 06152 TaxID=2777966 RepID=UPI001D14FE95|nr:response regulator [Nodosilinea sp. LEGE 06152]